MNNNPLNRLIEDSLYRHLQVMPTVIVAGARQTGKSTLVQDIAGANRRFITLDDWQTLDLAKNSPEQILSPQPVTIDEVQLAPRLLKTIKREIDANRQSGQFLLTGSANVLLMQQISESLAGRASYLNLWPMTRREQVGADQAACWSKLLTSSKDTWVNILTTGGGWHQDWRQLVKVGGFPTPALQLKNDKDRDTWFDGYVRTYLERGLQILSAISNLSDFRRLMKIASLRLGQIVNQTEVGRDAALPQATAHRYLNLLEASYLLVRLPAYSVNRTKRLIKSPKLSWSDTGVALHLTGEDPNGSHLENLIFHDLLVWRDTAAERTEIFYWRTTTGAEVDFVIETNNRLLPIEVKATNKPSLEHTSTLHSFQSEYGSKVSGSLLLHNGDFLGWLTADVLAAPWWLVI